MSLIKGLAKKIAIPAMILGGSLVNPNYASAQDSEIINQGQEVQKEEFTPTFSVSVGPALYVDFNDDLTDFYGPFFGGNISVITKKNPYFASEAGLNLLTAKGDYSDGSGHHRATLLSLDGIMKYFPNKEHWFLDVGISLYNVRGKSKENGNRNSFSGEDWGLLIGAGNYAPEKGFVIGSRIRFLTDIDLSGIELYAKIPF